MRTTAPVRILCILLIGMLLLSSTVLAAEPVHYTMTVCEGFVGVRDEENGSWIYRSQVPVSSLSQRDQLLLEAGIPLHSHADFTSAVEDFCS